MDYFDFKNIQDYIESINKTYNSTSKGAKWYLDTRGKLQYLITRLQEKLKITLVQNYDERPNGQAGRGLIVLKDYVLVGFIPKKYENVSKDIFLKIKVICIDGIFNLVLEIDINYKDKSNQYHSIREKIRSETTKKYAINDSFPSNWDNLVDLILPHIQFELNYFESLMESFKSNMNSKHIINICPLNQILFGPPGTGKTYNSIKKAVKIANPYFSGTQWDEIKEEFDRLVESGQVVFTTFHQSMSYEDFIEGIKPVTDDENGTVTYEVQKGIFKLISEDAQKNHQLSNEKTSKFVKTDFDTLWGILIEQISTTLESGKVFELPTLTNKAFEVVSISDKGNLKVRPLDNGQREYIVSYRRTKKLFEALPSLSKISNIDREFRNIIGGANSTSYWSVVNYLQKNINIKPTITNEEPKNFVIVIDEINRGNISQVFGELITLIEEDKREGKSEALKITLPYSKEKFSVPSNLYIIGTMNTADRSVEALDTALRRRFSFEEMPPKYDLEELNYTVTGNIKATDILAKINLRLEKLLDKDHLIGHSFFICKEGEMPLEKVKETFYKNIIPLLQEYFYGDYGKIGLVLGKGFIRKKASSQQSIFAEFEGYESNLNERDIFEIIDYRNTNEADTFENALKTLMK